MHVKQARIPQRRLMDCARESGASSWLLALPIEEHHFSLSKGAFRDAQCLRYGWNITNVSSRCACGATFDVDHAMSCHKGGLPTLRHNEVRDITAEMIKEVCTNVEIEPRLQPLDGETFNSGPPTVKMRQDSISGLQVSGVEDRRPSLTYVFFTLAPPRIETRNL